jgi:hypothetical protein
VEEPGGDLAALQERAVGHRLPGGVFRVEEYERFLSHDAMQAPPLPPGVLHPVWVLLGALRGMGVSIEELVAVVDAKPTDGVLFGQTTLDQLEVLRSEVTYSVAGEVTGLTRHHGKRAGTMDRMTFELRIADPAGRPCAISSQTFLILRGASHES